MVSVPSGERGGKRTVDHVLRHPRETTEFELDPIECDGRLVKIDQLPYALWCSPSLGFGMADQFRT